MKCSLGNETTAKRPKLWSHSPSRLCPQPWKADEKHPITSVERHGINRQHDHSRIPSRPTGQVKAGIQVPRTRGHLSTRVWILCLWIRFDSALTYFIIWVASFCFLWLAFQRFLVAIFFSCDIKWVYMAGKQVFGMVLEWRKPIQRNYWKKIRHV